MEPSPKRICLTDAIAVPPGFIMTGVANYAPQHTDGNYEPEYAHVESVPNMISLENLMQSERVIALCEQYSDILNRQEVDNDTSDPMKLLEKGGKRKTRGYNLLMRTITALVQAMDIDDPRDERVEDVVLLTSNTFAALREHIHDSTIHKRLTTRVKASVHAYKQRKKSHTDLFQNADEHLSLLYQTYPAVRDVSNENWVSSEVRPYGETAKDIVKAMGITEPTDKRIADAVTLMMDQYSVLRDQITNVGLRRHFVYRIKQAVSNGPKKEVIKRQRPANKDAPSYLEEISEERSSSPVTIELVLDGHSDDPLFTGDSDELS